MFEKTNPFKILKLILKYFTNSCWIINSLIAAFYPNKSCFNKSTLLVEKVSLHEYDQQYFWSLKYAWLFFFFYCPTQYFWTCLQFQNLNNWFSYMNSSLDLFFFLSDRPSIFSYIEKVIHIHTDTNFPALPRRKLFLHFCFPLCSKYKNSKL